MKFASIPAALCASAMLAMASATSALAQDAHQHTGTTPPAAASPATAASPSMPTQTIPTEMMQMMQMMQKMHSGAMPRMDMMGESLMAPGGAIENVEGHIAFLKAELKITDAQQKQWDEFADALRTNAKTLGAASSAMVSGMMAAMMGGADKKMPPAARLEQQEKLQTLQLEALKRSRTALEGLNAVLSDEQKQRLDRLI
jgi:predicted ATP-grasp superfamily ATP-dependent carboligase